MDSNNPRYLAFEDFVLDTRRRSLTRNGADVAISSRQYDLLLILVRNEGRTLTHEQLLDEVWAGTFVEQSNLKKGISGLRAALGETPSSSIFIKTIPRQGYSFVPQVRVIDDEPRNLSMVATEIIVEEEIVEDDRPVAPQRSNVKRTMTIAAALILFGLTAIAAWYFFFRRPAESSLLTAYGRETFRSQKLVTEGDVRESGLAADGKFVAYALRESDGRESLWLRRIGTLNALQLVAPDNVLYRTVRVAPEGDRVYFGTLRSGGRDELYEVGILGGQPRKVLEDIASSPSFSPDGKRFAFARDKAGVGRVLTIYDTERNSVEREIMTVTGDNHGLIEPRWSPDGRSFSYLVSEKGDRGRRWSLNRVDADGTSPRLVVDFGTSSVTETEWLPDGSGFLIAMEDRDSGNFQLFRVDRDGSRTERLTNDTLNYPSFTINRDGRSVLVRAQERTGDIWRAEWPDVSKIERLTRNQGFSGRLDVSPNGRIIAENSGDGDRGLVAMPADGTGMTPLFDAGTDRFPSVSADGRTVLFTSTRSGAQEIWSADIGGGAPRRLTDEKSFKIHPQFAPDGNSIYFERYLDRGYQLVKIPATGGDGEVVRSGFINGFDFSPDGEFVAFGFREKLDEKWRIGVAAAGNPETPLQIFDQAVSVFVKYSPDGKSLICTVADNYIDGGDLWLQPISGGPSRKVLSFPGEGIYWADFGPDGKLYFTRGAASSRMLLFTLGDPKQ